ncbi:MAG: [Fe-Fe] hydrogenase large subunit C-terminal domain-containing protein [Eubacteriales bacterium]|nr:[Fe-Fe] hydrogenase large subunit C-terminal domain-containing protein [Eubacteriales bacterium]
MKVIDFRDASCKHCYKCVRNCSVKAISVRNAQAHIITEQCIHCGRCLEVCPQNAKTFSSDMDKVKNYLRQGEKVVISIAPSYLGVLEYKKPGQVVDALLRLGFFEVRETSEGAAYVTREYQRLLSEGKMKNIITTCCPSVNDLVEKYYPSLTSQMAPVVSPMIVHGRLIKKIYGSSVKVVFLGPCIAKKAEAIGDERVEGAVDAILTFDEIVPWLEREGIHIQDCEEKEMGNPSPQVNRLYPVSGGIVKSVLAEACGDTYRMLYVDGLEPCMELFDSMEKDEIEGCFLEVNICEGGCIKGPASHNWNRSFVKGKLNVERQVRGRESAKLETPEVAMEKAFSDRRIPEPVPTEEELTALLRAIGKYTRDDELNCGACGYPDCRAKATAVFQKKAELEMCLPYAVAQAESMSNVVLDMTPNLNFIVDKDFRIKECNKKAQEVLGISREEALERYIFEFLDEDDIAEVLRTRRPIHHKKTDLKPLGIIAVETIVFIEAMESVLVIYQDVTKEEQAKEQRFKLKMETVEMAQEVIDKQMMVAQEIAGLLGETTAETKVTLTKLRDSILFEEEGE